ncbi:ROK family transcriptional regulator [Sediminibacillus massiliensis]|uniref:ROK family transcriptional regulator n=1 Tax=Sediminibacillus massiliensis TaxID=1926277 RepID=UPI0009885300|nr:ROK family transcriptional regulator [Sediminibacillus massiliensis]
MKMVILRGIRESLLKLGSATKAELSERLKISFPTISKFVSRMETRGEVITAGLDDSSGGRRAKRYEYNSDYMLSLSIFLERSETNYIISNCSGEVKEKRKVPSVLTGNILNSLTDCMEKLMENYPTIRSIAIGVPGSVDNGRIFFIPDYEELQHIDLKKYYEERFSVPVVVENDMNAAVLGYHSDKAVKEKKSLIYLYSGQNGPGAGIMINGSVVRGSTFFSGEVTFVPQYDDCNFGQALKIGSDPDSGILYKDSEIDAISRLIASFAAIVNPHSVIFCDDEMEQTTLKKIEQACSTYIPAEHLPELTISDWKQDYLRGLNSLGLDLMLNETIG